MDQTLPFDVAAQKASLTAIISLWKEFDLDGKRSSFDAQATEIGDNKEASVKARKNLAKQTQDFKKSADEEKLSNLGGLLKLYQEEIDNLTRRSKSAETSFLNLYKSVCEVQDPVPALDAALGLAQQLIRLSQLEQENKRLLQEHAEFSKEIHDIKNQEVTVRKLEDQLKDYESHSEVLVEEKVALIAKKLREDHSLEMDMLKERVNELQTQITASHTEQQRLTHALESTQSRVFDLQVQNDKLVASRHAELDLLTSDLERAQSHSATVERQLDQLRAASNSGNGSKDHNPNSRYKGLDLELEVAHKEIEVARLTEQVQHLMASLAQEQENNAEVIERLNNELRVANAKFDQLQTEASALPTQQAYDSLVEELDVLKVLVYGSEDRKSKGAGSTPSTPSHNASAANNTSGSSHNNSSILSTPGTPLSGKGLSVESALRDKARQLESDNLKLKMYLGERESEVATLRSRVEQLEGQITDHQKLIEKLEDDLARQHPQPRASPKLSPRSANHMGSSLPAANVGFPPVTTTSQSDMLEIVCGQRDRFRMRLTEMENENDRISKQAEISRTELNALRQDNVKLYEKIRYLQSYRGNPGGGHVVDVEKGAGGAAGKLGDELEGKYGKMYEDTVVNPFAIFNRKERYRRYRDLNSAERLILNTSQFFLSTKGARLFLFFYLVALHVLVMVTLYRLSVATSAFPPPPN